MAFCTEWVLSEKSTSSITAFSEEWLTTEKPAMTKVKRIVAIKCSTTGAIFRKFFLR